MKIAIVYSKVPDYASDDRIGILNERDGVVDACKDLGFEYQFFPISTSNELWRLECDLINFNPDCIFNIVEELDGKPMGEFVFVSFLDSIGFPYTGNSPRPIFIGLHKPVSKMFLIKNNVRTPAFCLYYSTPKTSPSFDFPAFLKPPSQDGSVGITKHNIVTNIDEFKEAVSRMIKENGPPILVEQFITGREYAVAVIDDSIASTGEISFPGELNIVSYDAKWIVNSFDDLTTTAHYPAKVSVEREKEIIDFGIKAFKSIGGNGYGRVDIRENPDSELYVIEINPNPDISPCAGMAKAFKAKDIQYPQMIENIIKTAINNYNHTKKNERNT